jgi:methionyl-tRNA synthetase
MNAHDVVETLGVKGYNDACRAIVQRYTSQWRETITRLGRWVDFDHDYKTMDPWFMESVWWVVKQLWEKDLVYQGQKVVPVSTALGTGCRTSRRTSTTRTCRTRRSPCSCASRTRTPASRSGPPRPGPCRPTSPYVWARTSNT